MLWEFIIELWVIYKGTFTIFIYIGIVNPNTPTKQKSKECTKFSRKRTLLSYIRTSLSENCRTKRYPKHATKGKTTLTSSPQYKSSPKWPAATLVRSKLISSYPTAKKYTISPPLWALWKKVVQQNNEQLRWDPIMLNCIQVQFGRLQLSAQPRTTQGDVDATENAERPAFEIGTEVRAPWSLDQWLITSLETPIKLFSLIPTTFIIN